jgi:two-component system, NarL family, nitrate/nitrite response regulator NarL
MTAPAAGVTGLLIIDDHILFREGLARLLESHKEFRVVGQTGRTAEALGILESHHPDVVLLDIDLGPDSAVEFVIRAKQRGFGGKILVVTAGVSDREAVRLVQLGVAGILHKHNPPDVLCDAIRKAVSGEVYLEPCYLKPLFHAAYPEQNELRAPLTEREVSLLRLIFQGLANKEIAAALSLSESAVKASLRGLFQKLGVRTRSQLVRAALEQYRDQL